MQAQAEEAAAAVQSLKELMSTREEELGQMTERAERASEATAQVGDLLTCSLQACPYIQNMSSLVHRPSIASAVV